MKENTKNVLLGVLIVGLVAMTVAYAALSTTLRISGTASVPSTTWNVHFANWAQETTGSEVENQQNTAVVTTPATLTQATNSTLISGLGISLKQPGDNIKFNFDIVNEGTIDAKLSGDAVISLTGANNSTTGTAIDTGVVTYNVQCDENENMLVKTTGVTHCSLTIKYNEDITNQNQNSAGQNQTYHQDALNLTLGASWNYVQR